MRGTPHNAISVPLVALRSLSILPRLENSEMLISKNHHLFEMKGRNTTASRNVTQAYFLGPALAGPREGSRLKAEPSRSDLHRHLLAVWPYISLLRTRVLSPVNGVNYSGSARFYQYFGKRCDAWTVDFDWRTALQSFRMRNVTGSLCYKS